LFDSFAVVNSFIAWRNHILKGRPEKERAWKKYGIREARLQLITRWAKRCSLHYERAQAHKKKRMRIVTNRMSELPNPLLMFELKGTPEKPGSKYHVQPLKIPAGSGYCVVCGKKRSCSAGDVLWSSAEYSPCAQPQSGIACSGCTRFGTRYRDLTKQIN